MPTIYCWNGFKKTRKSTAVPGTTGTSVTVALKDGTSEMEPIFILSGHYPEYSYVLWGSYYYYVMDTRQISNGVYELECKIDPWGTCRGAILDSTQFVVRSASAYNIWMKDIEMSNEQRVVNINYAHTSLSNYFGGGSYILRTISGNPNDTTGITTYVMSEAVLKVVLNWMFTSNNVLDAAWDTVVKTVFNPFQYIVSLKYTPLTLGTIPASTTATTVSFGWWTTTSGVLPAGETCKIVSGTGAAFPPPGSPITLQKPAAYFNDFRDYDPDFTEYRLTLPGGSMVTLPSILMNQTIYVSCICDLITNKAVMELSGGTSGYITSFTFDCCCDLQISQTATDLGGIVGNTGSAISSAIAKHPAMLGSSIAGAVTSLLQPIPSTNGQQGNITFLKTFAGLDLTAIRYGAGPSYPTSRIGRVLNDFRQISTLSGYCQTAKAAVDTFLPDNLNDEIESGMDSGFYIE